MKNLDDIKKIAKNCLKCKNPLCVKACPINNPIPEVLKLVEEGLIDDACHLLFNNTNSSLFCSKLCDVSRSCYGNCVLNNKQKAIPFYEVEEFLAPYYDLKYLDCDDSLTKKSILIVGSGLSGISLAIDFARSGASVTIVEKDNKIGGVITQSLPNFRFDDSIITKYEDILKALNVKICLNTEFGKDITVDDTKQYDVCVFAMGSSISKSTLGNNEYILNPFDVLNNAKKGITTIQNKKILVIGGGNVAMDVARTLNKASNEVEIVYRRDILNAPASLKEINDCINEGIVFNECLSPVSVVSKQDGFNGLIVEKMELFEDGSSRKSFKSTGVTFMIDAEYIVEAIGQNCDYDYLKNNLSNLFNESGWIIEDGLKVDSTYYFATGDYLTGASNFANCTNVSKQIYKKVKEVL